MRAFKDRHDAGRRLAAKLAPFADWFPPPIVLGLPRGGVTVAYEVAMALHAPLDIMLVHKLGSPGNPELAMGALSSGGVRVLNDEVIRQLDITASEIEAASEHETSELKRRATAFRGDRTDTDLDGRAVILVDDGLATGATMRAAIASARTRHASRVIVAVPVAPSDTIEAIEKEADETVCLITPGSFFAVEQWYDYFTQVADREVHDLLERAASVGDDSRGTMIVAAVP